MIITQCIIQWMNALCRREIFLASLFTNDACKDLVFKNLVKEYSGHQHPLVVVEIGTALGGRLQRKNNTLPKIQVLLCWGQPSPRVSKFAFALRAATGRAEDVQR